MKISLSISLAIYLILLPLAKLANWNLYTSESLRPEGLFARTRNRSSSGDKVICYGDVEQKGSANLAPTYVLDPQEIKTGSPLPRKSFPKIEGEPYGM